MSIYAVSGSKNLALNKVYAIENGKTKKLGKGYVIENGKTKKIYSGNPFGGFTGTYTTQEITKDGVLYTLYTMTGSGTLTLNGDAEYWMCAAGACGRSARAETISAKRTSYYSGNGGGGGRVQSGTLHSGVHVVTIGAGGTKDSNGANTKITGAETITAIGGEYTGNGASGGGNYVVANIVNYVLSSAGPVGTSSGQGVSTIPFGLAMLNAHSAGGGAGGFRFERNDDLIWMVGGNGGSDGSNGASATGGTYGAGTGGEKGGGNGGRPRNYQAAVDGSSATFYGSGGGGGALYWVNYVDDDSDYGYYYGVGGSGYQGVFYLLIPA